VLTVAGTLTANGSVSLGNATADDLTITASLASTVSVKTNTSFNFGDATHGMASYYIGGTSTFTTRLMSGATSTYTITFPVSVGVNGQCLQNSGSGTMIWVPLQTDIKLVVSGDYTANVFTITDSDGFSEFRCETAATDRTITLPTVADNTDRVITIFKQDTGAGILTIDGESTEAINVPSSTSTVTSIILYKLGESITLKSNGTSWDLIGAQWASFTYTPTIAASVSTNVAASVAGSFKVNRLSHNIIRAIGRCTIDPTASGNTLTEVSITLPIASNFTNADADGHGIAVGSASGAVYQPGILEANTADYMVLQYSAQSTANVGWRIDFTYTIQ
jgi:hypothetical protein